MQRIDFGLDRFIRTSDRVDLSEVEWARVAEPPLTAAEVRCLRYMSDIETEHGDLPPRRPRDADRVRPGRHGVPHLLELRRALATARRSAACSAKPAFPFPPDPESVDRESPYPSRRARTEWIRRRSVCQRVPESHRHAVRSAIASRDFVAIDMTWAPVTSDHPDRVPPDDREDRERGVDPRAQGDHQAGAPALRVLPAQARVRFGRSRRRGALSAGRWTISGALRHGTAAGRDRFPRGDASSTTPMGGRPRGDGRDDRGTPRSRGDPTDLSEAAERCAERMGLPFGL